MTDESFSNILDRFPRQRVLVIGDAMLDRYDRGQVTRLCREAPVPIFDLGERLDVAGGAANSAVNAARLGAQVQIASAIGDDAEGDALLDTLRAGGVGTDGMLRVSTRVTLTKRRLLAGEHMLLRVDQGSQDPLAGDEEARLVATTFEAAIDADIVIVSDYGYGVVTPRMIEMLAVLSAAGRLVVVDSKTLPAFRDVHPAVVKPNYEEACALLGLAAARGSESRPMQVGAEAARLIELTGARTVAATLDCDGALVLEPGAPAYRTYARPIPHPATAGAGDTFLAAFALALGAGGTSTAAAEVASAAAAAAVSRPDTSACSLAELRAELLGESKVVTAVDELVVRLTAGRERGSRVVFTNGCFDLLHRGHVTYLNRAKALGDVLVVGVNSDASVARLKGAARPINTLDDRLQVLSALSCVDFVIPFEDDTPLALLQAVRPDIFVKGGDYTLATLPEADAVDAMGGTVRILPYVEDHSTTGIIERIERGRPVAS